MKIIWICLNSKLKKSGDVENLLHGSWSHMEAMDEDEWLEHLEEHLKEIVNISGKDEKTLAARLEEHRREVHDRIAKEHPELAERFRERRHHLDQHLKERRPEVYGRQVLVFMPFVVLLQKHKLGFIVQQNWPVPQEMW